MKFNGGVKEAAKMLAGLGGAQAKKVLEQIRAQDPQMAAELEKNMTQMEDLQYLTTVMLVELLKDINLETFGLALRGIDSSITEKILSQVSSGIRRDIEDGLKGAPKKMSEVEAAQAKILEVVRRKADEGSIVIDSSGEMV